MLDRLAELIRRMVRGVVGAAGDRAPVLVERVYRAVAAPVQRADPSAGARSAQARLDAVRARVVVAASHGRVGRTEYRRLHRDLSRTRDDLERVAPHLPTVQVRTLALRLAGYGEALATFPGSEGAGGRMLRIRDTVLALVAGVGAWVGIVVVFTDGVLPVLGAFGAGALTARGALTVRDRRVARARLGPLAQALDRVDAALRGGPGGTDPVALDRDRRAFLRQVRASGRLDGRGREALDRIDAHLDDLLIRLVDGDLAVDAAHLVRATITGYLPDTLDPLLALPDAAATVAGRPATVEVAEQLTAIEGGLAEMVRRPGRHHPETQLLLQGEFLRAKFGRPPG
jgi:hypothetical protein